MNKTQAAVTLSICYTALAIFIGFVVHPIVGFFAWYSLISSIKSTIEEIEKKKMNYTKTWRKPKKMR